MSSSPQAPTHTVTADGADIRPSLTVLSGFWPAATFAAARALLAADTSLLLIRHDLAGIQDGVVRRVVRTGTGIVEDEQVVLRHGCISCTLRERAEQEASELLSQAEEAAAEQRRSADEYVATSRRQFEEYAATTQQALATTQQHLAATQQEAATGRQQLAQVMLEIAQAQQQLADLRQETWRSRQESDDLRRQVTELRLELTDAAKPAPVGPAGSDSDSSRAPTAVPAPPDGDRAGVGKVEPAEAGQPARGRIEPAVDESAKGSVKSVTTKDGDEASAGVDGEPTVAAVPGEGGRAAAPTKITSTGENTSRPAKPTTDERSSKPSKVVVDKD